MRPALRAAGVDRQEVDAINAHGTGTQANDRTETAAAAAAIRAVFGARADFPFAARMQSWCCVAPGAKRRVGYEVNER